MALSNNHRLNQRCLVGKSLEDPHSPLLQLLHLLLLKHLETPPFQALGDQYSPGQG